MAKRVEQKEASLSRILQAGAAKLCQKGLSGASISTVMQDAGLTHGTFYAHFRDKNELLIASLQQALVSNRPRWITTVGDEDWAGRLLRFAGSYLTAAHRDNLASSCALAALATEAGRATPAFRSAYEKELLKTIAAVSGEHPCDEKVSSARFKDTVAFLALCIGGLSLARAVADENLSDNILTACRNCMDRLPTDSEQMVESEIALIDKKDKKARMKSSSCKLEHFPATSYEKLRYADTDRQGHVNNAIFSTMLETGRVEILYNPELALAAGNCSFVIAGQKLDYLTEIRWPGTVDIGTRVKKIGRSSITFEQALFQKGRLAAFATSVVVQQNETTRRSEPLNDTATRYLQQLVREDKLQQEPSDGKGEL